MKVTAIRSFVHHGKRKKGETFEVSDKNGELLIEKGLAKKADPAAEATGKKEPGAGAKGKQTKAAQAK